MTSNNWIDRTLKKCRTISYDTEIQGKLIAKLVEVCFENQLLSANGVGTLFAAAFDLLIYAEYYSKISHAGWLYCPENEPRLFFSFTNCCPRHAVEGKFFFHPSNKPTSGVIGTATKINLLDESIDFIITSPPYLPASSGRENYLIGKSISLTALDLMNEDEIGLAEKQSVGSMKNQNGNFDELPKAVYELHDWLFKDELRSIKAQPTLAYYQDLKKSLQESHRVLKRGRKAVFIIGKETIFYSYKTREVLYRVLCDEIFKEIAQKVGFEISEMIDIELDKKNKNARPRSLDKFFETAIILRKN